MAPVPVASKTPWSERHRPRHLGEVVGNIDQVRKLAEWLRDWDDVVLKGKKKEVPAPDPNKKFFQAPENVNARAALISGPPGIGKTTTAGLVARCSRYKLMEFNASDARSKAVIDSMSNNLAGNRTLKFGNKAGESALERAVIIMDECDGMAGGGDKGGMQALIKLIQNSKSPVICICNDRNDAQVRQLATHCYDLKFRRPENLAVAKRIKAVVESHGQKVELAAAEAAVDACGQDIRQVINHLQFFGSLAAGGRSCQKDTQVMLSPFDACSRLLSFQKVPVPLEKRLDMFYIDTDMMPLMVQENYLRPMERHAGGLSEVSLLERCAQASELIAQADCMQDSFEVTNSAAMIGSIYPAALMASPVETFKKPAFPLWLQQRSSANKAGRTLQDIASRIRGATTCGSRELATSGYHDVLHRRLLKPLIMNDAKACAQGLHAYGLTRDFFTDQAPVLRVPLQMEDGYKKVEGKTKVQLLQEINELSQQRAAAVKRKKGAADGGGGKRRGTAAGDTFEEDGDGDVAMGEGDEADDHIHGLVKKTEKKGKSKSGNTRKAPKTDAELAKCSLVGWRAPKEKKVVIGADGATQEEAPLLVMRYIDGHTCSVRRKMRMRDFLGTWTLF